MKTRIILLVPVIMLIIGTRGYAQDKVYKDGTVWEVSFIKVNSNMSDDYLKSLKTSWKAVSDEAVKQGLILSYKVLEGSASNPSDFDIMLMTEFRNLASMEGQDDKWQAIEKKVLGSEENMKKLNESRVSIRTIFGQKLLREIVYQ